MQVAPGVPIDLVRQRSERVSSLQYDLTFLIPVSTDEPVRGRETITFQLTDATAPLLIDFAQSVDRVGSVRANGSAVEPSVLNEHIVIPPGDLGVGENEIQIEFVAGDESLNRNEEFLYTLFVPDRARYAFPCFDQPDLRARFSLRLHLEDPSWIAVSNAPRLEGGGEAPGSWAFETAGPISTYLFSFAAGRFRVIEGERAGRQMRMYHRETDGSKVARNVGEIFDLHAAALVWLEEYTGIGYPFEKFDFVLIPSFQYNGMEHPGAVLYRAERLLLDRSATQEERLRRASLVAHETAHMWFGDLVTMEWFDDVWMKEVFANFMAAKIVNPSFPELDHDLRFLLAHYPAAYEVDRSAGANPIRQRLDNLDEAGTLYGPIIYQKAPIVMRQLELLVGEETLRSGLRLYLGRHALGNASWPDLIGILDAAADDDLTSWSRVWVEEPGRPSVGVHLALGREGVITALELEQSDPRDRGLLWKQRLDVVLGYADGSQRRFPVQFDSPEVTVVAATGLPTPAYVLPNGAGLGYGLFIPDPASLEYLLQAVETLPSAVERGAVWLTAWDAMLEGRVPPERLLDSLVRALEIESEEQLIERLLAYLESVHWRFVDGPVRQIRAPKLERLLWDRLEAASEPGLKASFFNAYRDIALTPDALERLLRVWQGDLEIRGLPLSERDYSTLAQELAVRGVDGWERILSTQLARIENADRASRFDFVRPALSADPAIRDSFFAGLSDPSNRAHEPWVVQAVRYLHHPLRAEQARKYIRPSLQLLQEIQVTGDIFFPKNWLDATLDGHSSPEAAAIVRDFLAAHPNYPSRLRDKILQSSDLLFRAAAILQATGEGEEEIAAPESD